MISQSAFYKIKNLKLVVSVLFLTAFTGSVQASFQATPDTSIQKDHNFSQNDSQGVSSGISEKAAMWGLSVDQYKQYLKEMKSTPSRNWWKNIDPPQVLGQNATSESERMLYAEIDVRLDQERANKELVFQRAYSKEFNKLYPNAKLINFNDEKNSQTDTQPSVVNNDDQYFLFTKVNDPEGAMLADKLIRFMSKNSSAQLNIYFVGHVTFTQIQQWAINNNIPKVMGRDDRVTLNYNSVNGFNKLHQVIQDKSIKLPVMVRVREGESHLISLLTV